MSELPLLPCVAVGTKESKAVEEEVEVLEMERDPNLLLESLLCHSDDFARLAFIPAVDEASHQICVYFPLQADFPSVSISAFSFLHREEDRFHVLNVYIDKNMISPIQQEENMAESFVYRTCHSFGHLPENDDVPAALDPMISGHWMKYLRCLWSQRSFPNEWDILMYQESCSLKDIDLLQRHSTVSRLRSLEDKYPHLITDIFRSSSRTGRLISLLRTCGTPLLGPRGRNRPTFVLVMRRLFSVSEVYALGLLISSHDDDSNEVGKDWSSVLPTNATSFLLFEHCPTPTSLDDAVADFVSSIAICLQTMLSN